jgi:hypothetical protein
MREGKYFEAFVYAHCFEECPPDWIARLHSKFYPSRVRTPLRHERVARQEEKEINGMPANASLAA